MSESRGDVQAYVDLAQHMLAKAREAFDQVGIDIWTVRLAHWEAKLQSIEDEPSTEQGAGQ